MGNTRSALSCTLIARILTAPCPGAVAVIDLILPKPADADTVLSAFSPEPPRQISTISPGRVIYGRWNGEDVVVVRTEDCRWEIHCHGGSAAIQQLSQNLQAAGVVVWAPEHDALEANDDEIAAAVRQALVLCRTRKVAGFVLAQLDGPLRQMVRDARQSEDARRRQSALDHFDRWQSVSEHLTEPWRIAVVGPPNVGKSSLINALAGMQRSIVSELPGTTRDLVEVDTVFHAWTFRLIDTAGVRETAECAIETVGIRRSLEVLANCDAICFVTDASSNVPVTLLSEEIAKSHVPVVCLRNKCDLLPVADASHVGQPQPAKSLRNKFDLPPGLPTQDTGVAAADNSGQSAMDISVVTGHGLEDILPCLTRLLVPTEPEAETALLLPGITIC